MGRSLLIVLALCLPAHAEIVDLRKLVGHKWKGNGLTQTARQGTSKVWLEITLAADDTVTGKATNQVQINGVLYTSVSVVTGKLIPKENALALKYGETRGDRLPNSMSWCNNAAKPKHYLLKGTATGVGEGCPEVKLEYAD